MNSSSKLGSPNPNSVPWVSVRAHSKDSKASQANGEVGHLEKGETASVLPSNSSPTVNKANEQGTHIFSPSGHQNEPSTPLSSNHQIIQLKEEDGELHSASLISSDEDSSPDIDLDLQIKSSSQSVNIDAKSSTKDKIKDLAQKVNEDPYNADLLEDFKTVIDQRTREIKEGSLLGKVKDWVARNILKNSLTTDAENLYLQYKQMQTIATTQEHLDILYAPSDERPQVFNDSLGKNGSELGTDHKWESQGFQVSEDGTRVVYHGSTVPDNEYGDKFMNMDKGAAGKVDGKNYGVVCDGSNSGVDVMGAAQAFTESLEDSIKQGRFNNPEVEHLNVVAGMAFKIAAESAKEYVKEGKRPPKATAVLANFVETPGDTGQYKVQGAAIGDAIAISISREKGTARHLNEIKRDNMKNLSDSGGSITAGEMEGEDILKISTFSEPVGKDDVVILASDGLFDNLYADEKMGIALVIPKIIFSSKFDNPIGPEIKQPWLDENPPRLPTAKDLEEFTQGSSMIKEVTNETMARRLNNYVKFVTAEQKELVSKANKEMPELAAKRKELRQAYEASKDPIETEKLKTEIASIDEKMNQTRLQVKNPRNVAKTDDCMIIVMSPTGT